MIASGLWEAPKAKPVSGSPFTAPCSTVKFSRSKTPSSKAICGTREEMPNPRFTMSPGRICMRARRAMTFSGPSGTGSTGNVAARISPLMAGS